MRVAAARLTERRVGLLFAVFLAMLAFAGLRAGYLLAFKGGDLKLRAATQQVENVTVIAQRGTITDRNGAELAVSEDASTVFATPFLIKDPVGTARRVAPLIDRPESEVMEVLADRQKGFAYLARKVKASSGRKVERLKIEGIGVLDDARRYYPEGEKAAQVVGSVGVDNVGLSGVEQQLDEELRGADGEQRIVKDARGTPVSLDELKDGHSGEDLRLTLDVSLQDRAEQVLSGVGRTYQPKGATAIVMDPRTGDLLAMANWPSVDANRVEEAPAWARVNRAVGFTYEPGSTFKSFTVAGALASRVVRPETAFRVGPQIQVADRTIKEAHGTGGIFTVSDILARSSNVGAVRIGQRLGTRPLRRLGAPLRLRPAHRSAPAGRVGRDRAACEGLLGILDREPADRPGPGRHAGADGRRLRGDRERRRAGEAAAGPRRRAAGGPAHHSRHDGGARAAHAGGCARADGNRPGSGRGGL